MDDTDSLESRGTGKLAREIAAELSKRFKIFGVTRHQLFVHPEMPFTSHNCCAMIHAEAPETAMADLFEIHDDPIDYKVISNQKNNNYPFAAVVVLLFLS